jgi:glucan phosphoethanolaminetransferase (alkaline phosphatase superfamily)
MAGLLTHLILSLVGFFIALAIFKNWRCGIAFVFGHLVSDLISFGIAGIKQISLNPSVIMTNPWFYPLHFFSHNFIYWIIFATILGIILFILYKFEKINHKDLSNIIWILLCFFIGVFFHFIFDILIQETNYWI